MPISSATSFHSLNFTINLPNVPDYKLSQDEDDCPLCRAKANAHGLWVIGLTKGVQGHKQHLKTIAAQCQLPGD